MSMDLTNLSTLAGMKELLEKHHAAQAQLTQAREAKKNSATNHHSASTSAEISPKPKENINPKQKISKKTTMDSGEGGSGSSASSHTSTPIMNEDGSVNVAAYIQNLQAQVNLNENAQNAQNSQNSRNERNQVENQVVNLQGVNQIANHQTSQINSTNPLLSSLGVRPNSSTNSSSSNLEVTPNAVFSSSKSGSDVVDVENETEILMKQEKSAHNLSNLANLNKNNNNPSTNTNIQQPDRLANSLLIENNSNEVDQAREFARITENLDKSDDGLNESSLSTSNCITSNLIQNLIPTSVGADSCTQNQAQALVAAMQKQTYNHDSLPTIAKKTSNQGVAQNQVSQGAFQMQNGQIQSGQIQNGQIQNGQIQNGQIQNGQIQNGQIQNGQLQSGLFQNNQLQNGQIQNGQIQNGQIQNSQIQNGQLQNNQQIQNVQQAILALNQIRAKHQNSQNHQNHQNIRPMVPLNQPPPPQGLPTLLPNQQNFMNGLPSLAGLSLPHMPGLMGHQSHQPQGHVRKRKRDGLGANSVGGDKEIKTCLICGDRATGLHYGIISCEGCKGFFKRSICNRRVYRCSRNGTCEMSRKQRNRCQYCRLKKCLQVGMNRKAIREDGMPGGRNKNIGPVQLSMEEVDSVLTGREFNETTAVFNSDIQSNASLGNNGMNGMQNGMPTMQSLQNGGGQNGLQNGSNNGLQNSLQNLQNHGQNSLLQSFDLSKSMQTASQSMARFTQGISSNSNLPTLSTQAPPVQPHNSKSTSFNSHNGINNVNITNANSNINQQFLPNLSQLSHNSLLKENTNNGSQNSGSGNNNNSQTTSALLAAAALIQNAKNNSNSTSQSNTGSSSPTSQQNARSGAATLLAAAQQMNKAGGGGHDMETDNVDVDECNSIKSAEKLDISSLKREISSGSLTAAQQLVNATRMQQAQQGVNSGSDQASSPKTESNVSGSSSMGLDKCYPDAAQLIENLVQIDTLQGLDSLKDISLPFMQNQRDQGVGSNKYQVKKEELLMLLAKCADEMLVRQTNWIKKLPFYEKLSVKDHITLLTTTWPELNLLAAFTVHKNEMLFGVLSNVTSHYDEDCFDLNKFTRAELEILERLLLLFQRLQKLQIDEQEYVVMKVINFLNQDIKNLENPVAVEEINKTYWYKTQAWIEMRHKFKTKNLSQQQQQQMMDGQQQRFRQLMLCLPEVRSIAGRLQELHLEKVPLMLKALLHTIKVSNPVQSPPHPVVAVPNSFQQHVQQTIATQLQQVAGKAKSDTPVPDSIGNLVPRRDEEGSPSALKRPRTSSQTISKQSGKSSSSNNTPLRQFMKQVKREGQQTSNTNSTEPSVSNGKANNTSSGNSGHERSGSRSSSENNINTESGQGQSGNTSTSAALAKVLASVEQNKQNFDAASMAKLANLVAAATNVKSENV